METVCKTLEIPCINKKLYWNDLNSITKDIITKYNITKGNITKGNITEDNITEGNIIKNNVVKYNINMDNANEDNGNNYHLKSSFNTYLNIIKILSKVKNRDEFQRIMIKKISKTG